MDAFEREVGALVDELKSPKQRSTMLAGFARDEIAAVKRDNEKAIGATINAPAITVDGRQGAKISDVRPDGIVQAVFNVETEPVLWILRQLEIASPKLTGRFSRSHRLFVDGSEYYSSSSIPTAKREYVIVSDVPYARKIEGDENRGPSSRQARNGVYFAVATVAKRRFVDVADIIFSWETVQGGRSAIEKWARKTTLNQVGRRNYGLRRNDWLRRQPAITIRPRS